MTDLAPDPNVRPMTQADYGQGQPLNAMRMDHPTRDLIVGAVVGAAALWVVPRVLDLAVNYFTGGEAPLEFEDEDEA